MSTLATAEPRRFALRGAPAARGIALGFVATLAAGLVLAAITAAALGALNEGRVLPGVRVGNISLAGLNRAGVEARLESALPPVAADTATLVIAGDQVRVTYQDLGRAYEMTPMVDAALGAGRASNPLAAGIDRLRALLVGAVQPIQIQAFDSARLDEIGSSLALRFDRPAVDAGVVLTDGRFVLTPAQDGVQLETATLGEVLGFALGTPLAGNTTVDVPLAIRPAVVSTAIAQRAANQASQAASGPLTLTDGTVTATLSAAQIASLVSFASDPVLGFTARINDAALTAQTAALAKLVNRPAVDATYRFGARIEVIPAVEGRSIDEATTAAAIRDAIGRRLSGGPLSLEMPLSVTTIQPTLSTASAQAAVAKIVRLSTWTTHYITGPSNGYGANISIPAMAINGKVIAPGAMFDFWKEIGPVTFAAGYRIGGAIINGRTNLQGALAGGICSTSTTLFNTALRAGLEMHDRRNHYYYISRYPVGLDATVFAEGTSVTTMSFRNDTPYPLIIRSYTGYGFVRFDLYGVPTGRSITFSKPAISNYVYGHDSVQYTTSLKPGVTQRVQEVHDGFDAVVTRWVRDAQGNLIHTDTFFSHYHAVTGILLVGKSA